MPARFPTTGPANVYIAAGGIGGTFIYLGTCETAPIIRAMPAYKPVFNDLGGPAEPSDWKFSGETGMVVGRFNRWDTAAYAVIASRPAHIAGVAGINPEATIGVHTVQDGGSMGMFVQFPDFAAPNNVAMGMPVGYRFFAVEAFGPDEIKPGTDTETLDLVFRCMRVYVPPAGQIPTSVPLPSATVTAIGAGGGWAWYDNVAPTLPAPT